METLTYEFLKFVHIYSTWANWTSLLFSVLWISTSWPIIISALDKKKHVANSGKMRATHMHILRPGISAGQLRSRSTCPCGGHRRPSHCTALRSAGHSSCSSHTRPGWSSPQGHRMVFPDTCRATGRTAASQQQPAHLWEPAVHCSEPCWTTGWGGGGQRFILRVPTTTHVVDGNGRFWKAIKHA